MELEEGQLRVLGRQTAFAATMFTAGVFVGVDAVMQVAVSYMQPLNTAPWVGGMDQFRMAAFALTVLGFAALLCFEYFDS